MGKSVFIAEKPSVAEEFGKALHESFKNRKSDGYLESDNYIVTWCVGHLVTMCYPDKYDPALKSWRLDTLPFIPEEFMYEIIPSVEKQFNIVKSVLTRPDVDTIYVCTDSGREGEYIYRLVRQMAGVTGKTEKRVWIDSQTEEEILKGIKTAKDISEYNNLSDAAYLRAKEDYLMGINFSRVLTLKYGRNISSYLKTDKTVISVGRVMTCVLGMIVRREREIRAFVKMPFYRVIGKTLIGETSFDAEWKTSESSIFFNTPYLYKDNGFKDRTKAQELVNYLSDPLPAEGIVTSIERKKEVKNPPLLFNLAELQNECSKLFKISPDQTLAVVQELYEKKLVTYPRTDARVLSTAVAKVISKNLNGLAKGFKDEEIQGYIKKMVDEKYSTDLIKTKYVNDSKITDHYAIIPTGQGFENYDALPDLQKQMYKVIVKRFLSIFYPPAEYSKISVTIEVENEQFSASGRVCEKLGYLEVAKNEPKKESTEEQPEEQNSLEILRGLKKGEEIAVLNYETKSSETSPPSRYNSGSMILAMENAGKLIEEEELREQIKGAGIGTSATRAEIMKKLERIGYIAINTKTQIITPTEKGEKVYDIVFMSMPDMLNPKLTASWEKGLEMVSSKQIEPNEFMTKLEAYINSKIDKLVVKR